MIHGNGLFQRMNGVSQNHAPRRHPVLRLHPSHSQLHHLPPCTCTSPLLERIRRKWRCLLYKQKSQRCFAHFATNQCPPHLQHFSRCTVIWKVRPGPTLCPTTPIIALQSLLPSLHFIVKGIVSRINLFQLRLRIIGLCQLTSASSLNVLQVIAMIWRPS